MSTVSDHVALNLTVLISHRDSTDEEKLQPFSLEKFPQLRELLTQFSEEKVKPIKIAAEIITVLFKSEFSGDSSWIVDAWDSLRVSLLPSEENLEEGCLFPVAFVVEKRATYDNLDVHSLAKASAKVLFVSAELIQIEDYSYAVTDVEPEED